MDIKSFSGDDFNAKEWINNAFQSSNQNDNKEIFLSNTLSTLQLYMQQLNNALEETTSQVFSGLPKIISESHLVEAGAKELSSLSGELEDALTTAQQSAGHPLHMLQRTDRLKAKLEMARHALQEADKWAALSCKLETALEAGEVLDLPSHTKLLEDMNECLDMLSGSSDHEDKRIQLEGLKNRLEAVLSPTVVEAFTEQQSDKCKELWKIFLAMRRKDALSVYRARCEASALKARIPAGIATLSPLALRDLHAILLRHASHQLEWAPSVCPGEETLPWLVRLYGTVLSEINANEKLANDNKSDSSAAQLDQLGELLVACDHFSHEIFNIVNKEQEKKGKVSEVDLQNFAYAVYSPVRNGLSRLGRLLASAMSDDLGPTPALEANSTDIGTTLQLRISKGLRTVASRLTQGKNLSRGAAPVHLTYAAQWLIEELCTGWTIVDNLTGCLLLLKASAQLEHLVADVESLLVDSKDDEALLQRTSTLPQSLRNWSVLLKTETTPLVSSSPLNSTLDKLCKKLRQKALNLVLAPISSHLDSVEHLQGWCDNDQYAVDLPDFSLSPQEYITQVGQYLMTLPQHLEPLLERGEVSFNEEDPAYRFLNEVCNAACEMFAKKINSIKKMDSLGVRKCSTDIAYLTSVLEELEAGSSGLQLLSETVTKKQTNVE
ncbi:conserved oligomeric Golgi complex subunit 7 [Arctopsyche grandis]|uniref:conserved oligomeric Golgi complex subunit 7 n=1 Tax=Arctopsyche grandis TaxID=121162 RepID=UPI00406D9238